MDADANSQLAELLERERIRELLHRYCYAVDRGTLEEVMALFDDDCNLEWIHRGVVRRLTGALRPRSPHPFLCVSRTARGSPPSPAKSRADYSYSDAEVKVIWVYPWSKRPAWASEIIREKRIRPKAYIAARKQRDRRYRLAETGLAGAGWLVLKISAARR